MGKPLLASLIEQAGKEPIGVDISDYSDDFCVGFMAGQKNVLEEIAAGRLLLPDTIELRSIQSRIAQALVACTVSATESSSSTGLGNTQGGA